MAEQAVLYQQLIFGGWLPAERATSNQTWLLVGVLEGMERRLAGGWEGGRVGHQGFEVGDV
jgi:hypothetical protein